MNKEWLLELSKLIRAKNLLLIALTLCFTRLYLINPVFFNYKIEHALHGWEFALFALATLCIAAAGYIINDYFDVDIDRINKPDNMVIGNFFVRGEAFRLHLVFNGVGIALGFLVAWLAGNVKLGFIFAVIAGLLWFYAKTFKKVFLLGNLLVAILTALTVLVTVIFETNLFYSADLLAITANKEVMTPALAYALFALLITLIREIIKDMQDVEGDREYGCNTISVVLGVQKAKWFATLFIVLLICCLFFTQRQFFKDGLFLQVSYIFIAVQLPLAALLFYLVPASQRDDFGKLSEWLKIITLLGIGSMPVFHYFA